MIANLLILADPLSWARATGDASSSGLTLYGRKSFEAATSGRYADIAGLSYAWYFTVTSTTANGGATTIA